MSELQVIIIVQLGAFEKIFKKFDLEKTGTLTAEELHKCINQLAGYNALSRRDVMHILSELDVKGTGDIEFDEFIYFMTRPQVNHSNRFEILIKNSEFRKNVNRRR